MTRTMLFALLMLASCVPAGAKGPEGPAADVVRKWFTSDLSLGCVDRDGNDRPCRFDRDSNVAVRYAPDGETAVAFATYANDETGNAEQFAVAVFRSDRGRWRFVRNAPGILGRSPSNVTFSGETAGFDTVTLRDADVRCCPTGRRHWSVPLH